ncbi:MAG TPA: alanine--tRNA ligase [Anaerolineales bacterium]|nr:alanine--tRNA ligase [Anaerolineales bacterium]
MTKPVLTGNQIRQQFIDFFIEKAGHTFVPSASLVPGGDATLLFTNAGMVQFKDVFLGTDKRPYTRAVNSQKCMRVAGKHNDLEDVGQDDTHHTFFEMLGNWSFGDYYKKEAIAWAWELLTEVWGLERKHLYATVFRDEKGEIPADDEAAEYWRQQPGFQKEHLFYLGRKDNFWEMADTGPCGPCSEIHIDLRPEDGPVTRETLDTDRFIELWNLVFIQYNRLGPKTLEPLPATHVDTGMGLERIVNILQNSGSNYRTDLLWPLIEATAAITGHTQAEIDANFTPYRVIADHGRSAAFLVADGVVPGNLGRNYICRMIIRRAYRFGGKLGLHEPFLAPVADAVIEHYGGFYPELRKNRAAILATITREEEQFQRTLDRATARLTRLLDQLEANGERVLSGAQAADLYTTLGMPFEITRDIAQERGLEVDERGFREAMESHRLASGAGKAMGALGGEDVDVYRHLRDELQAAGKLPSEGVDYNPYADPRDLKFESELLALMVDGRPVETAAPGDHVEVLLPETRFYVESGGQVSDMGEINARLPGDNAEPWRIRITEMRKPAAGIIVHVGEVVSGNPKVGDAVVAAVDAHRRKDIMRNHTATHLLHAALHEILGPHARQAGSLVAPDRLRFDFTHPEALTYEQIEAIERYVNDKILDNYELDVQYRSLQEALDNGAIALFGEKYSEVVRNIRMGETEIFSNELCGGTHVEETNDIGIFMITHEGSAAAGIRRIEAITGREAFRQLQERRRLLNQVAAKMGTSPEKVVERAEALNETLNGMQKQIAALRQNLANMQFTNVLDNTMSLGEINVLTAHVRDASPETLRQLADQFRQRYPEGGVLVLGTVQNGKPLMIAAVTEDLIGRGIKAGDLVKFVAQQVGGGGGGRPTMAQAGGRDPEKLDDALASVPGWLEEKLKAEN